MAESRRLPIYLLLDTSGSMSGEPIEATRQGVKALLADGWSCLGSANLNQLSLRLNQEQNIATSDPAFAARLKRELFEEDFAHSFELKEPVTLEWTDVLADLVLENF